MRISLNWLKEYVDLNVDVDTLARQMTMLGLEIEAIERPGAEVSQVYIGKILSIEPHPDADKLVVCKTDTGGPEPLQIVCGAKNMKVGDKVPTAIVGATLPGGFEIGRRKMRGIESQGMMCSVRELGLGDEHEGLMILPPTDEYPIGADAKALLGLDDVVFDIEVIPNRGDWASMIGVARELAALHGKPLRIPEIVLREEDPPASSLSSVTNDAPDLCPRYIGRVLSNVKIGPSPAWLCRRLEAAGQRPINNVVDITNYVLMETGHPLHAFDYEKLAENRIVVRRAASGETMQTLDDETRALNPDMLVIADAKAGQAVAGIMGGGDSEVGETTTKIFLESAVFKPGSIRSTSRALGLITESSQRFQRGADPEMAEYAINRAAMLMQELAGATLHAGLLDAYPAPFPKREVTLRYERTGLLLGTDIPPETQRNALVSLGFEIIAQNDASVTFGIPSWRHDVAQEADLIEEVARLFSYDNIPVTLPQAHRNEMIFAPQDATIRALRRYLAGLGLTEFFNWTFSNPELVRMASLPEEAMDMVALANPLSEKQATMRSSLVPGMLQNVAYNLNHGVDNLAAFEIGPIYKPLTGKDLPEQIERLAIMLTGEAEPAHWSRPGRPADFYDIKGYAQAVFAFFDLEPEFQKSDYPVLQPGQAIEIRLRNGMAGLAGKVCAGVLKAFDIDSEVYLLEIYLDKLLQQEVPVPRFESIPAFPPSRRDMALLIDKDIEAGNLLKTIRANGGKLLKSVEVFDVYEGGQIPNGKKSVALKLVFQAEDRTLTDADTDKAYNKILKQVQNDFGVALR